MKYDTIILEWKDSNCYNRVTLHNIGIKKAIEQAEFFGYIKPKWYQFWKPKLRVYPYNSKMSKTLEIT